MYKDYVLRFMVIIEATQIVVWFPQSHKQREPQIH